MEISQVIYKTLEANDALDLLPLVRWEWNTRLSSTMGRYFPVNTGKREHRRSGLVEFSTVLFSRATQEQRDETVAHEICHMIVDHRYPKADAHGWEWRQAMQRAGYAGNRCHNVAVVRRRQARVRLHCGCDDGCIVTKSLYTRMIRNGEFQGGVSTRRYCRTCKQNLRLRP